MKKLLVSVVLAIVASVYAPSAMCLIIAATTFTVLAIIEKHNKHVYNTRFEHAQQKALALGPENGVRRVR